MRLGCSAGSRDSLTHWILAVVLVSVFSISLPVEAQVSLALNRLIVVSASGTPIENCQTLRSFIIGIDDASATHPYLVQLEPGVYDCDFSQIVMKDYISIEGAGSATLIRGRGFRVVELASNVELRSVKVENYDDICDEAFYAIAAFTYPVENARLVDVVAEAMACKFGVALLGWVDDPDGDVTISHSTLRGAEAAIHLNNNNQTVACEFSVLDGGIVRNLGSTAATTCLACTNATELRNFDCTSP